jgi:hypothetical protein
MLCILKIPCAMNENLFVWVVRFLCFLATAQKSRIIDFSTPAGIVVDKRAVIQNMPLTMFLNVAAVTDALSHTKRESVENTEAVCLTLFQRNVSDMPTIRFKQASHFVKMVIEARLKYRQFLLESVYAVVICSVDCARELCLSVTPKILVACI